MVLEELVTVELPTMSATLLALVKTSDQEVPCLDRMVWFAVPPIEPRLTHASSEKVSAVFSWVAAGTETFPLVPLNDAAGSTSPVSAPGWESVVPVAYVPSSSPRPSHATVPDTSPRRQ